MANKKKKTKSDQKETIITIVIWNFLANKTKKTKSNQKEIIITIVVLIAAIILGFIAGKALFDAMY